MPILFLVRIMILLALTAANLASSVLNNCESRRCRKHGPIIRFPFRLKDQPQDCGYPGFDLSCNQAKETILDLPFPLKSSINKTALPFPVKFIVKKIDYKYQILHISKVDGCFPKLLPELNLTASPFGFVNAYDHSFFNCSSRKTIIARDRMISVPCLSSSSYPVYAIFTVGFTLYELPLYSCTKMFDIPSIPFAIFDSGFPLMLDWSIPNCEHCEAQGKYCGLQESSKSDKVVCIDKVSTPGLLRKIKIAGKVLGSVLILLVAIGIYLHYRSKKLNKEDEAKIEKFLEDYRALKPSRYSYADIKKITENFKENLGQGGYGTVYKGKLSNEVLVAVKVLHNTKEDGEEFINEVGTIGRIHHVNVVRLVGYCADGFKRVLVYEFLPNGSLDKFIPSERKKNLLGWVRFEQISLGVAKGIEYLHQGCEQRILHFDIKPHNILLDNNYNPKVADFGLAKLCSKEQSIVSMTAARGTIGYIAPEVFSRNFGNVSCKSDVYSFGMLLLEMLGGRRNNTGGGDEDESEAYFPEWMFKKLDKGEEIAIQIVNVDDGNIARKLAIVGLWCIQWCPIDRPSMKKVIQMLEEEGCPPLPQNHFGSTNKEKNGSAIGKCLFKSELQSISKSDLSDETLGAGQYQSRRGTDIGGAKI